MVQFHCRYSFLAEKMTRTLPEKKSIDQVKKVILIGSGKGGVGKSTVSVNLAIAISKLNQKTGLLDADVYGPSIPTMLNIHKQDIKYENNRFIPPEINGLKVMSMGFLSKRAIVWRGLLVMKALQQLTRQVDWGELDYLIIDLPPGTGDVHLSLIQTIPIDGAILVSTPQRISWDDVSKAAEMFKISNIPLLGYIVNMSKIECPGCKCHFDLFPQFAPPRDMNCLGTVHFDTNLAQQCDHGSLIPNKDFITIAQNLVNSS